MPTDTTEKKDDTTKKPTKTDPKKDPKKKDGTGGTAAVDRDIMNPLKTVLAVYKTSNKDEIVGWMKPKQLYKATIKKNDRYYVKELGGWVKIANVEVTEIRDKVKDDTTVTDPSTIGEESSNTDPAFNKIINTKKQKELYSNFVNAAYSTVDSDTLSDTILASNLNGVLGIPYQFPNSVDRKLKNTTFGAIYTDRILSKMPLLFISPGQQAVLKGFSDTDKGKVYTEIINSDKNSGEGTSILGHNGKYYSFDYDTANYWDYVNGMCHACAAYLDIADQKINICGTEATCGTFKWEKAVAAKFSSSILSNESFISIYCDAETTRTEDFSNSTQESMLASAVNKASDLGKEVRFIIGTTGKVDWVDQQALSSALNQIQSQTNDWLGGSQLINNIASEFAVVASGGKLIFPEIWSDSTYTQDFDVKIKLRCPCPNKLAWFLDICVPINHLLALTLPRAPWGSAINGDSLDTDPSVNGFFTPFLVRAFYKGMFNCDMGIVTSLNIQKGKEGGWTMDGLPSVVDISMQIKDLYNVMCMSKEGNPIQFLNNSSFLAYLANSCGISINQPDIERSLFLMSVIGGNGFKVTNRMYNWWRGIQDKYRNKGIGFLSDVLPGYFG